MNPHRDVTGGESVARLFDRTINFLHRVSGLLVVFNVSSGICHLGDMSVK
ncbi:hypothetical protein K788_0005623 [Paraburkholderia caribensis MBA4]|uniref:Uncharacterized protein n=1 Tax=Paraburkholderia caribensis MBA4 TaxID=1323664 RepID=A0A0P0RBN1_9BURK|nr:hypothetical protein K788_0005623 [Paraburkholderia caribensis MBA4]